MEPFTLMLWVFVVPLHAYALQPSVNMTAMEESGNEGTSREYGGDQESVGQPLPTAGERDSHGDDGAERGMRPGAGEAEREEGYNAAGRNGENQADDGVGKGREGGHRGGDTEEHRGADGGKKKKNEGAHGSDDERGEKEGELRVVEKEEKNWRAQHGDDDKEGKKERELGADNEKDERREEENGEDEVRAEDEMLGEEKGSPEEHRVEEEREERQKNGAAETDTFRLSPSPSFSAEKNSSASHQGPDPLPNALTAADNRPVTPTVSHVTVTAGQSREATFTPDKTNNKLVRPRTLTDGSRSHLREEEGLVPKAIEVKVGPFGGSAHTNLSAREQRTEKRDDYCPLDCACYGRVVQCSDKGIDKIPYGIPYNSRYILLMNNRISWVQLDLLQEYQSLEFLVLSNNRLTDGGIEGAFEGVVQLKRLYLDRNHLSSIPADLPSSLEELRLDSNEPQQQQPGGESVPGGVFGPLGHLRTLSLTHNHLTVVPLRLPANVKELYLRGNRIERVLGGTFAEGSDLLVLDLSANRLTDEGLAGDSLRPLVHLENFNLEGNFLRQVPQQLPPSLRTLNLEGNAIGAVSEADFLSLPHLEHLGLARNQITRVAPGAFWGLPVLHQLELGHNVLRQVPRRLPPSLRSVSLVHNKIRSIPRDAFCSRGKDPPLSGLVTVHLENNLIQLGELDSQAFSCLRGYQVVHFY
ncbi:hypothetical protein AAFF_G00167890 [Aldrovandia affinis]|uniref:LRRNT domain-containing protein n=1 Tax=Aldrovandia affinis TaxID=143900 RepID=A0AAD7RM91_9TELE|nr:hypothetical protein AAFF_G00167890 [Aldrovandia affinis]